MSKHRIRVHKWVNGILEVHDHFMETLGEAMKHVKSLKGEVIKIYDADDQLVHIHADNPNIADQSYA